MLISAIFAANNASIAMLLSRTYTLWIVFLGLLTWRVASQLEKFPPSVHTCVHAARKLSKRGDGSTRNSCMGCDPTYPSCSTDCQALIDRVYLRCDDICLPNGYFFDPQWELEGCWAENKAQIKIKVERCGCNAAYTSHPMSITLVLVMLGILGWVMW